MLGSWFEFRALSNYKCRIIDCQALYIKYICPYILYYRNCSSSSYWTLNYLWQMAPLPVNEWKVMNHLVLHFCTILCGSVSIKKYLLVYNFELGKMTFTTGDWGNQWLFIDCRLLAISRFSEGYFVKGYWQEDR